MASAIAFALPEYVGGIVPICGSNPIGRPDYLRHRAEERLSVAFVTGETDFNRKENEEYLYPFFQELAIRSKLWVVPGLGHALPGADPLVPVYAWLKEDLKRRQSDAKLRPGLAIGPDEAPADVDQAERFLKVAQADLENPERTWRGVALLQGIIARWGKTELGHKARNIIRTLPTDPPLMERLAQQGALDEQKFLTAQARAFERLGRTDLAVAAWSILVKNYPDDPIGDLARKNIRRLKGEK
jgi:hypothetical protein